MVAKLHLDLEAQEAELISRYKDFKDLDVQFFDCKTSTHHHQEMGSLFDDYYYYMSSTKVNKQWSDERMPSKLIVPLDSYVQVRVSSSVDPHNY